MSQPPLRPPNDDADADYSPSATLLPFDTPVPLLRHPFPAGSSDDQSVGQYVLAFRNPESFLAAYKSCESKLLEQCEAGVRIGCSVAASDKCKRPWWKTMLLGGRTNINDFKEREKCEEREMAICLEGSREKCLKFAKEKCLVSFRNARIACSERRLKEKEARKLISCVSGFGMGKGNVGLEIVLLNQLGVLSSNICYEVTNYRGSELLRDEDS